MTDTETATEDEHDRLAAASALATDLHDRGGVPERRAEAVALVVCGFDRAAVVEVLGLTHPATVSQHVATYRDENLPEAQWLAEHGPEV